MKTKLPLLFSFLLLASTLFPALADEKRAPVATPLKALLLVGGCCHDYPRLAPLLTNSLHQSLGINFDVRSNLDLWKDEHFADACDLLMYDICFDNVDAVSMEHALNATRAGKPTVLIHCAVHAFRKSEKVREWENLCGMRSKVHDPYQAFTVEKLNAQVVTKNFPATWKTSGDELYQTIELITGSTPLLQAKSPRDGRVHTVCWVHQYGQGRVFATTLGHDLKTAETPEYSRLLADGVQWAMKKPEVGR